MSALAWAVPWAALSFCISVLFFSVGMISDHDAVAGESLKFYMVGVAFLAFSSMMILIEALNYGGSLCQCPV